jgi:heat shock protein HslJ
MNTLASNTDAQAGLDGKWKLTGYNFSSDRDFPIEKMTVDLTIENGNHVGGNSSCNLYSGNLTLGANGAIKVGTLTTTDRPCSELTAEFESLFLDVLRNANVYTLEKGVLTLNQGKTKNFLRFGRQENPTPKPPTDTVKPAAENTTILYVSNKTVRCQGIEPMRCMQIKQGKSGAWQRYYDSIVGFDFKPGSFYKIEVEKQQLGHPSGDTSIYRYRLVRIVKKVKKEAALYN